MRRQRALFVIVAAVFIGVATLAIFGKPVLMAIPDTGDVSGQPVIVLMNPFRNRAPERVAEAVLQELRSGGSDRALSQVRAVRPETYDSEKRHRLQEWTLVRRTDTGDTVDLVYRTSRSPNQRPTLPVFIQLQKTNGEWIVNRFAAAY